jgi:two-component system NarL family sensor kinase
MNVTVRLKRISPAPSRGLATATSLILVSLSYYLAAEAAFAIGTLTQMFAPFWPPNVVLLCTLLVVPPRKWWLFIAAVFPAHAAAELGVGMPVPQLIAAFACNVAVALLNAAGLRYFISGPVWLGSLRNVTIYVLIAVLIAPGVVALAAGLEPTFGDGQLGRYPIYWWRWYLSNALGSLTLTPVFLAWVGHKSRWPKRMSPRILLEVVVLCLGMVAACSLAFGTPTSGAENLLPALLYAPIPLIIWATLRFRSRGASGAILVVTVLALWHEMQGHGPFVGRGPEPSVLPLQLFLAAISTPVLFLSALIEELRRTNDRLGSVLSGISDCYFTLDHRWRFTAINSKAAAWVGGGSPDELIGREYEEVIGTGAGRTGLSSIRRALGDPSGIEVESVARPGQWIDLHAYPSSEGVSVFFRDITQRKSVELALQRSMKYLQLAQEAAGIGTWEWDITTGKLTWSPELYQLFGVDPASGKDALQGEWRKSLHPEDRDWAERQTQDALAAQKPFSYEFRIIRSGEVRWMISRGKVIRDKSGRPERIIGASIDITDRKRAEEELSRSEERFREMAETVPDILFTSDPDGGCDYLSSHYYEYTGLPTSSPIGPGCIDAVHPDDRDRIVAARRRARISGESFEEDCRLRAADGSYRWFVIRWRAIQDDSGRTVRWFGAMTDINALKRTEEELRRTNDHLERLMDQMTEYQYSLDWDWRLLECNAASAARAGGTPEQLVGRNLKDVIPALAGSQMEREFDRAFRQRAPVRFEAPFFPLHSDNWQEFNVYPIPEGITIFATDITQRKRAEFKAQATQMLLQSSLDALSAHVAILDGAGKILAVNEAWRSFAEENGFSRSRDITGLDYLEVCDDARPGCGQRRVIAAGLKAVMDGVRDDFRVEYPCLCASEKRWFQFRATRFGDGAQRRVAVAHEGITEVKRAEEALHRLTSRLLEVQDTERRRIARDLHDSTAQHVVGAAIGLARALRLAPELIGTARTALEESSGLIEHALREIRTVSYLLHPPMLDEVGLPSAIQWYVEGFARRSGIKVDLYISPALSERRLTLEIETALFRVLQEALANVHRHSGSPTARVRLTQSAAPESQLVLAVEDDGIGDQSKSLRKRRREDIEAMGVGVAGMRERLTQLKGRLEFQTGTRGTIVQAIIPNARHPRFSVGGTKDDKRSCKKAETAIRPDHRSDERTDAST